MTTALATSTDVQAALGRALTTEEAARVASLLLLASTAVEDATGYRFAPGTYSIGRTVRRGRVKLPAKVASVQAVRSVDQCDGTFETLTDYTFRTNTVWVSACYAEVDFTVSAAIPTEIVTLVAAIVGNTLAMPAAGASSETAGPFTISYVSNSGRVFLTASDKAVLRRYKQPKPALDLLA